MKNNKKKIFIEALEQRIMLDGAGASTALDVIDERSRDKLLSKNTPKISKFAEHKIDDNSQKLPFDQLARDQKRNDRKQVVFIDSQVQDYQTLINAFNEDTEVYLIQSSEDGFKKIDKVLKNDQEISSLHIIGHGSAGKILFGNATLSNDTIQSYNQTLRSIGQSLTEDGDILFYGCNVASTEGGKALISKISEITKADIAASDDVTGKGGDWELEKKIGVVETQNVKVVEYDHSLLQNGITSINSNVEEKPSATDFRARAQNSSGQRSTSGQDFIVALESENVSNAGSLVLDYDDDGNQNVSLNTANFAVNSYLVFLNDDHGTSDRTGIIGQIVFTNEIYGIFTQNSNTIFYNNISKSGATYPTHGNSGYNDRKFEDFVFYANNTSSSTTSGDWVSIGSDKKTLRLGAKNGDKGDYIRVITAAQGNRDPVARDDSGTVNENSTLTVDDGDNPSSVSALTHDSSPKDVSSEDTNPRGITFNHDGTKMYVTGTTGDDINEYTLTTAFDVSTASYRDSFAFGGDAMSVKFSNDGKKMFTLSSFGVKEFLLNTAFDITTTANGTTPETTYSVSSQDGNPFGLDFNNDGTKMFMTGNNTDFIYEYSLSVGFDLSSTVTYVRSLDLDDYDDEPFGIEFNTDGTRMFIVGTRGNGVDEYKLTTGFDISTASHVCFLGVSSQEVNPSGVAFNNDGSKMFIVGNSDDEVNEYALTSPFSLCTYSGIYTGDVITTSDTNSQDTDLDGDTLSVSSVRLGSSEGSGTAGTVGQALTGTYGQLTLNANGSYTYAANTAAADALDPGDVVTESFNYTVSDGNGGTDIAVITITIIGINDNPVANNDTNSVAASQTLTVTDGSSDVLNNDTDVDAHASLSVSSIIATTAGGSATDVNPGTTYSSGYTSVTGSYGTLRIGADGTYQYIAGSSGGTDVFTYTLYDGTATTTATLTITVNSAPVAADNTGIVNEDGTLTVSDGASANSITTAAITYDANDTFDMSAVSSENFTAGLAFNNDGTRMFHGGNDGDAIKEYHLSTAYDVSTASYQGDAQKLDVSGQTDEPFGLTFNNDGTKLYVSGGLGAGKVFQYTLGTAYDVSTQTGSVVEFAAGDTRPCGIRFNNDGTKLFVAGFNGGNIEEIHLSTAYDLSTASRSDSNRLNVSAKETLPRDIEFNIDGTRMFVVGGQGKDITEYKLSTAYDVSTGTYVGEYNIRYAPDGSEVDGEPFSLLFNKMGTKMFMMGYNTDDVHEYNLTSPYNLINVKDEHDGDVLGDDTDADSDTLTVTAVRTGSSEGNGTAGTVGAALTGTYGQLTLNSNGSYTYVANQDAADALDSGDVVTDSFNYTVSDGTVTDIAVIEITVIGINDSPVADDETGSIGASNTLTVTDGTSDLLHGDTDVDASASLNVTSIVATTAGGSATAVTQLTSYNSGYTSVTGSYGTLRIGADGTYQYIAGSSGGTDVFTYTLSDGAATDTGTLTITVNSPPVAADNTGTINENATLSVSDGASANDVTPVSRGTAEDVSNEESTVTDVIFNPDGTKMFITGPSGDEINEYTLSTAFDPTSATHESGNVLDVSGKDIFPQGIAFNNDGTKIYMVGNNSDEVHAWSLGTAYSLANVHATNDYISGYNTATGSSNPRDIMFNNDGTKMYILHGAGAAADDRIFEYTLSTPYDPSTKGSASSLDISDPGGQNYQQGMSFNHDGTRLFIAINGNDQIVEYELTTAFDIDGGHTYKGAYTVAYSNPDPAGIAFNHDGTKMFNADFAQDTIETYTLVSPYNLVANVSGEHDGDVLGDDTDANSDSLTVTSYRTGATEGSGTAASSVGSALTGTYGQLTLNANGSYSYAANQSAAEDLDAGDVVTDSFNYTVSDGTDTDIGKIVITIVGVNDSPTGVNDTDSVNEDATITQSSGSSLLVADDTDVDDHDTLTVTAIQPNGGSSSSVALHSSYNSNGTSVTGTYGTLTVGADGTYTYVADQSAADDLDLNDNVTDVFTYTVSDGAQTDTATLTITVTGVNDSPVAVNDTDSVNEDATVTQSSGSGLLMADDSDADDSASITVTQIAVTGGSNSAVTGGSSYNSSGTTIVGTYGTLTVGADGTYTYVADQSAADDLDAGDTVTDSFTYTISDGTSTDTATLIITVTGVNDTPTAGNETVYINENNTDATHGARTSSNITKNFAASDFTNYADADDDDSVGIKIKSLPTSGTLTRISNGNAQSVNDTILVSSLRYTPNANSESDDSFTYRAWDGDAVQAVTYTITISVNAAPVAVNDTGSITAGDDDATGNVLTNDTDSDDASSALGVRGVGAGAEGSTLANSNVGSAVSGTYGDLTINSGGAYTYSVTGNAATIALRAGETATDVFSYKVMDDETNAGSKAIDIGTITFTITGIDGDAKNEPNPDEVKKPKKEKREEKRQKREEDRQLKKLKREKRLERKELKIPKSKLAKSAEFNQGLKLVDLVAESNSLELKDKGMDIHIDKIVAKQSDKALKLKFKVFNDEGKEVQKYYGEMKDGSALPDWIKINPKTGKTKTDIPKGMKIVEFKIIAVDVDNNKKQVTVIIDKKKIAEDKEILKQSRKIERVNKLEVKNDGAVKLNSINEQGKIDKTKTDVINEIEDIDELVKTIEPNEFLNLKAKVEKENFEVELPWQNLKVVLNNGQELPQWIKYDPKTGKVTATPPENVKSIDLKVIIENPDGELSVKDIKLDFINENAQETKNIIENETKFVSLSSQLSKEYSDWDDYGSQLIDRL